MMSQPTSDKTSVSKRKRISANFFLHLRSRSWLHQPNRDHHSSDPNQLFYTFSFLSVFLSVSLSAWEENFFVPSFVRSFVVILCQNQHQRSQHSPRLSNLVLRPMAIQVLLPAHKKAEREREREIGTFLFPSCCSSITQKRRSSSSSHSVRRERDLANEARERSRKRTQVGGSREGDRRREKRLRRRAALFFSRCTKHRSNNQRHRGSCRVHHTRRQGRGGVAVGRYRTNNLRPFLGKKKVTQRINGIATKWVEAASPAAAAPTAAAARGGGMNNEEAQKEERERENVLNQAGKTPTVPTVEKK